MPRFLAIWLAATLVLAAAVLALNVAVDPYGILGTPRIPGLTADKLSAADRPRLTKPYLVEQTGPAGPWSTLVMGASNADVGFDPNSQAWPAETRPVFNLAIDGADTDVQARFLQHALATNRPKLVLIGLSLEDAMIYPVTRRLSAAASTQYVFESRLRVRPDGSPNPDHARARLEDFGFATFSTQALTDSLATLIRQNDPERTHETAEGFNTAGSFARWVRTEGSYSLVMNKDRERTPQLLSWSFDARTQMAGIASMIRDSRAKGARVIVFMMPGYVDQLEIMRQTGITPLFERWKQDVARTVEQQAGAEPIPLWDFSGYGPYTTEPLPGPGDTKTPLRWFWEFVHFRAALGDLMVRRMLGAGGPPDLGETVTTASLPARFAAYARAQQDWVASHPADVARIAQVVDAAAHQVCGTPIAGCPKPGVRQSPAPDTKRSIP